MRILLLSLSLVSVDFRIEAQSTIRFGFDGLPVDTLLREQFAPLGVHFAGGRYGNSYVIAAPSFPQPPATHVALSSVSDSSLAMWFDFPIASVSMDVAIGRAGGPSGTPIWYLGAVDTLPPSAGLWSSFTSLPGFDTWRRVRLDVPADRTARALTIQAINDYGGLNYPPAYYFANIEVTYTVPEPSTGQFAVMGIAAFIGLWLVKRQKSQHESKNGNG